MQTRSLPTPRAVSGGLSCSARVRDRAAPRPRCLAGSSLSAPVRSATRAHAPCLARRRAAARSVRVAAGDEKKPRPQDDPLYASRLFKLEADQAPGRDNITSNVKLAAGVAAVLAALTYGFLASNGLV